MNMMNRRLSVLWVLLYTLFIGGCASLSAQEPAPKLVLTDSVHNFGFIAEEKGAVSCTFSFTNEGDLPLIITQVTTDCGCTTSSYTQEVIEPGAKGSVQVSYNPAGRPGTFVKNVRIYSNSGEEPVKALIKGTVTTLGGVDARQYSYEVGPLKVSNKSLSFPIITLDNEFPIRLVVNNPTQESLRVKLKTPSFAQTSKTEFSLAPQEPEELFITPAVTATLAPKIYREPMEIEVFVGNKRVGKGEVMLTMPFLNPVPIASEDSPRLDLNTYVDLGVGEPREVYVASIELKNTGSAPLRVYGASTDSKALDLKVSQKVILPNRVGHILYSLDMKEVTKDGGELSATVSILVNDPMAPLRKVKIIIRSRKKK